MARIGDLPDETICNIVSFLSAKEAAFARTLSRRWGNLFRIITKLWFEAVVHMRTGSFERFVHELMALPVVVRVRALSLTCYDDDMDENSSIFPHNGCILCLTQYEDHISRCLRHVLLNRGVVTLKIYFPQEVNISLPTEIFTSKTVSTMKLRCCFEIHAFPADVYLPSLKSLFLERVSFYASDGRCSFQTLLSASPVLEELVLEGLRWESWKWCCTVSSTTLRRLTIRRRHFPELVLEPEFDGIYVGGISLDTPALQYLYYSDYARTEYPIVNLDSLVEAKLYYIQSGVDGTWDKVCWNDCTDVYNPINLFHGIKNIEILEMFGAFRSALPVFEKLRQLSVDLYVHDGCWNSLPALIERFPNLKTFTMESLHIGRKADGFICPCVSEYAFLSPSSSCPLEVIKINRYRGAEEELSQIKLMLEKALSIKLVKVAAQVPCHKQLQVMEDLVMLPRASTECIIEVNF